MYAPGHGAQVPVEKSFPKLDDHVVEPEGREELLRGRKLYAAPAHPEHGDPHFRIDATVGPSLTRDRVGSTDMITRVADDGDLATDTSIRRRGIDPATGQRYLEEMVFEVVNTQRLSDVTAKAEELAARGVRRIFAVFVRKGVVSEWRDDQWEPLSEDDEIVDECLASPIPVKALLRDSEVGPATVRGLLARKEPALLQLLTEREEKGELDGRRAALRTLLAARGLTLDEAQRARVEACDDVATLDAWITRAATATGTLGVFG